MTRSGESDPESLEENPYVAKLTAENKQLTYENTRLARSVDTALDQCKVLEVERDEARAQLMKLEGEGADAWAAK